MKKYRSILLGAFFMLTFTSCNGWFDVTPSSEIRKGDHYKTTQGFQQTLTGCYIVMSEASLYGQNLTWLLPELWGHQFELTSDEMIKNSFSHNYKHFLSAPRIETVWDKSFNVIVNANDALDALEGKKDELNIIDYSVIKGELLAVRAYMHFDLLRLFGFGDWANRSQTLSSKLTIPYLTGVDRHQPAQKTGADIYKALAKDLDEAAALLKAYDPIAQPADVIRKEYAQVNVDGYYNTRNIHLNYYAVKALQARVHLWFGTQEALVKAGEAAREVVEWAEANPRYTNSDISTEMHLMEANSITRENTSLFTEALFALEVPLLENFIKIYFIPEVKDDDRIAFRLSSGTVQEVYEGYNTDARFSKLLHQSTASSSKAYTSLKYYQADLIASQRGKVNLIRIPEVYYIAAEVAIKQNQVEEGLAYLNKMRETRGVYDPLADLTAEEAMDEVRKEYRKEFISEGVMFFYYKRNGFAVIPQLGEEETMDDTRYVLPFPNFELQSGYVQF